MILCRADVPPSCDVPRSRRPSSCVSPFKGCDLGRDGGKTVVIPRPAEIAQPPTRPTTRIAVALRAIQPRHTCSTTRAAQKQSAMFPDPVRSDLSTDVRRPFRTFGPRERQNGVGTPWFTVSEETAENHLGPQRNGAVLDGQAAWPPASSAPDCGILMRLDQPSSAHDVTLFSLYLYRKERRPSGSKLLWE
jgi:hypothetical protein